MFVPLELECREEPIVSIILLSVVKTEKEEFGDPLNRMTLLRNPEF